MKTAVKIALSLVLIPVGFYAVIGVACMHMTAPIVQVKDECDKVQRIDGRLWCMNSMQAEDDGWEYTKPYVSPALIKMKPAIPISDIEDDWVRKELE